MTDPSIMLLKKWRKASDDMLIKISMAPERKMLVSLYVRQ